MKVEIDIPDKYKDTNLYLMWGMVPIARRSWTKQYWEVKTEHCSQCGKCCEGLEGKRHPFKVVSGVCEHLRKTATGGVCDLGSERPFGCSVANTKKIPSCTVKWEKSVDGNLL